MRYFLAFLFIWFSTNLLAQISADFNLPAEVCQDEQFQLDNTSLNSSNYLWDFCPDDFSQTPTISSFENNSQLANVNGLTIFSDSLYSSDRYVIVASRNNDQIFRYSLSDELEAPTNEPSSLIPIGQTLGQPIAIDVIYFEGEYFGYFTDLTANKLYEIKFGVSLENTPQSITDLGNFSSLNQPNSVKTIIDESKIKILVSNFNTSSIQLITRQPDGSYLSENISTGSSSPWGIDLIKYKSDWLLAVAYAGSNTIRFLQFTNALDTSPENIYSFTDPNLSAPGNVKFAVEKSELNAFVQSNSGAFGRIYFGEDYNNSASYTNYGNLGALNTATRGFDIVKNRNSKWQALITQSNSVINKIEFPDNCNPSALTSKEENPITSYSQPKTYPITLTAFDANGNFASITKDITVSSNQAPEGIFALDSVYCIADNISFNFNTTDDIATYNWDFGDGNTSTAISPTYQYATDGEYYISLEVESVAGCYNIFYDTLNILPEPQPEFITTRTEYCTFEAIDFDNITPFDYGENIKWSWDFNGEGSSTAENPSFTFETAGTKTITLEANVLSCVATFQATLEIIEGPEVDFSYDSNCLGEMIQFTNLSTGANITGYLWDFGNGQTSTAENPQIAYNNAGSYAVSLTVSNSNGCENTVTQSIQIFDQIIDSIKATEAVENLTFNLGIDWVNDFDSTQNLGYQWEINGEIQTTDTATYTLGQGTYTINLEVTTENNCLINVQRMIEVNASEYASLGFNLPTEVCLNEQFQLENTSANAVSYQWDFCPEDFNGAPTADLFESNTQLSNLNGLRIYSDSLFSTDRYVFIASRDNDQIYKYKLSDSLENPVDTPEELIPTSLSLGQPVAVDIIYFEGEYYGYFVDLNANKLYEIRFGTSLDNSPQSITDLGGFSSMNLPNSIKLFIEGGSLKILVSNFNTSNINLITRLSDGSHSSVNIPTGSSSPWGMDLIKYKSEWLLAVVYPSINTVRFFRFQGGVDSSPEEVYSFTDSNLSAPGNVKFAVEKSELNAFVQSNSGAFGRIYFGSDYNNSATYTNYGNLGTLNNNTRGFDIVKNKNSQWQVLITQSNTLINKIVFPNDCYSSLLSSKKQNPTTSLSQPSTYPITLTAYHPNGNSASITKEITVTENQAPEIAFTSGADLCVSAPIQFSSESNAAISTYNWDFGDGNTSTEANPAHLFSGAGEYLVQLSVTDTAGCNNLFQDSITIYAEPQPDFQASAQGSICSQKPVVFENTTVLPTAATFLWDLGDGTTSTEENPEHIYAADGEYIVSLQIEMAGCLVEKIDTITVNPGPLVDFNYNDDCFGQVVNFENSSTGDFLQSFQWDFGDGTQSTQTNPNHSYDSAGTYHVELTALTSNGCDYTFQKEVVVHPVATVAFESEVACANQPLQFNEQVALQQSNITDYLWDFGVSGTSSGVSTEANPEFTFPSAGTYEVSLQVTTADGCTTSGTQTVSVNALPQPSFSYEDNCLNNAILFSPENTDNIVAHFWELQNAAGEVVITAQSENFSYAFENAGTYQLRYRQQNENLCSNSITETIEILPLPEPDFQVGSICANNAVFFENLTDLKGNILKNYNWSIDGEVISTDFRPQYTFQISGDFLLSLQVETQNGCIQSIEKTISVSPAPTAFFELEQTLAAYPYSLSLSAQSQGQTAVRPAKQNTDTNLIPIKSKNSTRRTIPTSPLGTKGLTSPLGIEGLWTLNNDTISTTAQLNHTITQPGTYLLGLILTNEAGCTDSHYEQIRIREPNLDIALSNLRITQDQDFTGFVLNISNRGTLVPERLDLEIDLGSYSVTETIEEPLLPERNRNVALSIKLTEEQIRGLAKICIRAIPHNDLANETYENNNRVCTNIETGLTIMEIYPNPVVTQFTLPIILPENAVLSLSLEQSNGQNVEAYSYDLEAGYHEIQLDRGNIKPGIYFLRIRYQGKETVKKIIFQ